MQTTESVVLAAVSMQQTLAPNATLPHVCPLLKAPRVWQAPALRWAPQEHRRTSGNGRHAQSCSSMRCSASSRDDLTASNLGEVAALDQLIDLLKNANGERELTKLVAENVLAFDSGFWLRLATRADAAQSQQEKQQLANLANVSHLVLWTHLPMIATALTQMQIMVT